MISESHRVEANTFKVCICGQQGVGKTALLHRRLSGAFMSDYMATIAAGFGTIIETVGDQNITLNIWDTAGQEKYQSMMPLYLRNCDAVVLVLDVTSASSWTFVKNWIENDLEGLRPRPHVLICVNKADLPPGLDLDDLNEWASELGYRVYQTSALSGAGILQLFQDLTTGLANRRSDRPVGHSEPIPESPQSESGCC
jgi:small GTP-binding protein